MQADDTGIVGDGVTSIRRLRLLATAVDCKGNPLANVNVRLVKANGELVEDVQTHR